MVAGAACLLLVAVGPAAATHPGGERPIHPGVRTATGEDDCTANFVFTDGRDVFLGQAAHCTANGSLDELDDGCRADSLPLGTPVYVEGATQSANLAYSSWLTMQAVGEDDRAACRFNDFALIRLADADVPRVSPSLPISGGPGDLDSNGTIRGEQVYAAPRSAGGTGPTRGTVVGGGRDDWLHTITIPDAPGTRGDSGTPVVDAGGDALGVIITAVLGDGRPSNGVTELDQALAYLNSLADRSNAQLAGPVMLVTSGRTFAPARGSLLEALMGNSGLLVVASRIGLL